MKRSFLLIAFLLLSKIAFTQYYLEEVNGRPIKGNMLSDVTGNPYLFKDWRNATIQIKNGKTLKDVPLNIDLVEKNLVFKGPNNEKLLFVDEVTSFVVPDTVNSVAEKKVFKKIDPSLDKDYFLVLAEGKLTLLKKLWKIVWEEKVYNSATLSKSILDKSSYYILSGDGKDLISIGKPNKKNITEHFPSHKEEVLKYIKDSKVNFNNDSDLTKLFIYFNSL